MLEKAIATSNSYLINAKIDYDSINELSKKIFVELQYNTFGGMEEEDILGHIANFLGILDPIKITVFDTGRLRLNIFPLSLTGTARGNDESGNDIVSSDEEWEEHEYRNPPNIVADLFTKPNLDAYYEGGGSNHKKWNRNGSELGKFPTQTM
ncbi:hypothetical protein Tco_0621542 [Tanacetum coccineum]